MYPGERVCARAGWCCMLVPISAIIADIARSIIHIHFFDQQEKRWPVDAKRSWTCVSHGEKVKVLRTGYCSLVRAGHFHICRGATVRERMSD
jgi:hypothetical protein